MRCPRCGFDIAQGARFCGNCASRLSRGCPACGHDNPVDNAFCGRCGTWLRDLSGSPPQPVIQWPSAKAPVAEAADSERRQLTVVFCDLVGSTALSQRLDPEDLRDIILTFRTACADCTRRFEGYIARYVGDGLLIYFGYPWAHDDDAVIAIRAGL